MMADDSRGGMRPRAHAIRGNSLSTNLDVAMPPDMRTCGRPGDLICRNSPPMMFTFSHITSCSTERAGHGAVRSRSDLRGRSWFTIRALSSRIYAVRRRICRCAPATGGMSLRRLLFAAKLPLSLPDESGYNLMKNAHARRCAPEGPKKRPSGAKSGGMEATCRRCRSSL